MSIIAGGGEGGKKQQKCLKLKFGHLINHGGGLNFSKLSKFLSDPILKTKN